MTLEYALEALVDSVIWLACLGIVLNFFGWCWRGGRRR